MGLNRFSYSDIEKVVCIKSYFFPTCELVMENTIYSVKILYIDGKKTTSYVVYKGDSDEYCDYIGFVPSDYFISLTEFRNLRINEILN